MDIKLSNVWILAYALGNIGTNGGADIFLIRVDYNNNVLVTKITSISDLTCTATKVDDKIHVVWSQAYVRAVIMTK